MAHGAWWPCVLWHTPYLVSRWQSGTPVRGLIAVPRAVGFGGRPWSQRAQQRTEPSRPAGAADTPPGSAGWWAGSRRRHDRSSQERQLVVADNVAPLHIADQVTDPDVRQNMSATQRERLDMVQRGRTWIRVPQTPVHLLAADTAAPAITAADVVTDDHLGISASLHRSTCLPGGSAARGISLASISLGSRLVVVGRAQPLRPLRTVAIDTRARWHRGSRSTQLGPVGPVAVGPPAAFRAEPTRYPGREPCTAEARHIVGLPRSPLSPRPFGLTTRRVSAGITAVAGHLTSA